MSLANMPPVGRSRGRREAEVKRREISAALLAGFSPFEIAEEFGTTEMAILLVQQELEDKREEKETA